MWPFKKVTELQRSASRKINLLSRVREIHWRVSVIEEMIGGTHVLFVLAVHALLLVRPAMAMATAGCTVCVLLILLSL